MIDTLAYPDPPLSDGTVLLRPWSIYDLPAIEQASRDPYIVSITRVPSPYTDAAGREWLAEQQRRVLEQKGLPFCIADAHSNDTLGFISPWLSNLPEKRVHFGYWVIPQARGRGAASHALNLLCAWVPLVFDVARLELAIEPWNVASRRVAERAGFRCLDGRHQWVDPKGDRHDVVLYVFELPRRGKV